MSGTCVKSLFQKIGFGWRVETASKVQILYVAKKEIVYQFHDKIAKLIEEYQYLNR